MNAAQDNTALDPTDNIVVFIKRDRSLLWKFCLEGGQNFSIIDLPETKRKTFSVLGEE
jgi:hypothetical protein